MSISVQNFKSQRLHFNVTVPGVVLSANSTSNRTLGFSHNQQSRKLGVAVEITLVEAGAEKYPSTPEWGVSEYEIRTYK